MIGTTIGKYRVQDRIGRGGMGTVYLATDATLHREVAIKVLNSELNDPEVARRFRSEAITVARLSHPGIATVYELFEHDAQWLMVMEFVRGETLEHLVERSGPQSLERAVDLCIQTLTALAHAHSMGVVHRDLKPANLMVTESGLVKVMDFGIARVAGSEHLTTAGFMMGTPAYMAPEQVLGHEIDARADLYAMGVVLYRLATSKLPFKGETPFAMAQSQVSDPPTPVRLMREGLPPWIEQVIGRALSKAPGDRFQTADEFRETLKRGLAGLPIDVAPNAFMPPELLMTVAMATPATGTGATPIAASGQIPIAGGQTGATAASFSTNPAMAATMLSGPIGGTGQGAFAPGQTGATAGQMGGATGQVGTATGQMGDGTGQFGATGQTAGLPGQTASAPIPATGAIPVPKRKSSTTMMIAGVAAVVVLAVVGAIVFRSRPEPVVAPVETPAAPPVATDPAPTTVDPNAVVPGTTPTAGATTGAAGATPVSDPKPTTPVAGRTDAAAGRSDATAAGATAAPTPTAAGAAGRGAGADADMHVQYADVKMTEVTGKKGQDRDVVLNLVGGQISVIPKKGGSAVVSVPYKKVLKGTYVRAKDPKWDVTLPYPTEGLDLPGILRGAKDWLVLQWKTGYMILKVDSSKVDEIIATVETRTGIKIDRPAPAGK